MYVKGMDFGLDHGFNSDHWRRNTWPLCFGLGHKWFYICWTWFTSTCSYNGIQMSIIYYLVIWKYENDVDFAWSILCFEWHLVMCPHSVNTFKCDGQNTIVPKSETPFGQNGLSTKALHNKYSGICAQLLVDSANVAIAGYLQTEIVGLIMGLSCVLFAA